MNGNVQFIDFSALQENGVSFKQQIEHSNTVLQMFAGIELEFNICNTMHIFF